MSEKKAAPTEASATIKSESNHTAAVNPPTVKPLSPRERRLVEAIARGWLSRQRCDDVAGTTNAPDLVRRLRLRFGEDLIGLRWVDGFDRDGRPCRWGEYALSHAGRDRLVNLGLLRG